MHRFLFHFFLLAGIILSVTPAQSQTNGRYIDVTGTAEIEIIPDKIHYIVEIKEYFKEEFETHAKPEEYRTKVSLSQIEQEFKQALMQAGIPEKAIRTQEIGNYWREPGKDFLISKQFDITLTSFDQINKIIENINTRGISNMHIGTLENKNLQAYKKKGQISALNAAREKAEYLVEATGNKLGNVIHIVENDADMSFLSSSPQRNIRVSDAFSYDEYRVIKKSYSLRVRFEIVEK